MTQLNALPEELLMRITDFLDEIPPSQHSFRQEPSLRLTTSDRGHLKAVSQVSHKWRRLAIPQLFKCSRLQLDIPQRPEWNLCPTCNPEMLAERLCFPAIVPPDSTSHQYHIDLNAVPLTQAERTKPLNALTWLPRFYHTLDDFLRFVRRHDLAAYIQSLVVCSDKMLSEKLDRFPHRATLRDWRYPASAAFWQHVFSVLNPTRIVIVAPPTDMACLTNCAIDTFGDWAFSDMELHSLELCQDISTIPITKPHGQPVSYSLLKPNPTSFPGVGPSSILHMRPWTHCSLNEGSFLKAYGTYEYFERGPPSVIYSIKDCLGPRNNPVDRKYPPDKGIQALRSFTYTGIFPFANHIDFNALFSQLELLDVQLAPDPQSGILDDKARTGKAELGDCWQELTGAYNDIARSLSFPPERAQRLFPNLKKFVCKDYAIPALKEDLDLVFQTVDRFGLWSYDGDGQFLRTEVELGGPASSEDGS
ncbi:hypothetical protein K431DRAFT_234207 [Polychaeton citri CBS 116435]|uniref:F-box domain-containing protein n=1 Tax=Polychaeton citri CBS 116435 TaxID=1314669 RepID=A0A9P4PXW2_9PEZI|nr:hypothetical protein K431DRAFT_234207 [Polychaeton citri CBS 116435]